MERVLYCWELGAGFGHIARMEYFSNLRVFEKSNFTFALKHLEKYQMLSKCNASRLFQSPTVNVPFPAMSPCFPHVLRRCGFNSIDTAKALVAAWRNIIRVSVPDLVILDHSPGAAFAALSLGIPIRQVGNGFELPEAHRPMAAFDRFGRIDKEQLEREYDHVQIVFDELCAHFNLKNSISFRHLYCPETSIIATHPLVDHVGPRELSWRYYPFKSTLDHSVCKSLNKRMFFSSKPKVFFYLDPQTPKVTQSLIKLSADFSLYGYIPKGLPDSALRSLREKSIQVYEKPLDVDDALEYCDFAITNGGVGMLGQALQHLKPVLMIPRQVEQSVITQRLVREKYCLGLSSNGPEIGVLAKYIRDHLEEFKSRIKVGLEQAEKKHILIDKRQLNDFFDS